MFLGTAGAVLLTTVLKPGLAHRIALEDGDSNHISLEQDISRASDDDDEDCLLVNQVRLYCPVGTFSGACYNSTDIGVVQCFAEEPPECAPGHDLKCAYSRFGQRVEDEEVPICDVCEAECQLLVNHWGACYTTGDDVSRGDRCRCVPKDDAVTVDAMHEADHCLTWRIGESHRTYDGVCRFPTDVSSFGLQECLDIPSFPGKCPIEHNPGACYSNNGGWMCWAGEQWFTDRECREVHGFDGACIYHDFNQTLQEEDIAMCDTISRVVCDNCNPVEHWGGCYEESRPEHACLCAPRADGALIDRMHMNLCRTQQVEGRDRAYSGVCRLPSPPDEPEERPECLEIASFRGQCPISEYLGACYREDEGDWQCWTEEEPKTPFDCRQTRDESGHTAGFTGACEFGDYGQLQDEAELPKCNTINKCMDQCEPVRGSWGACYPPDSVDESEPNTCFCAPRVAVELVENDMLRVNSCQTKMISGLNVAYEGVCRFPEDISELDLPECLGLPHHAAKCSIASSPGACYSDSEDRAWSCWSLGTFFAEGECRSRNFTGACKFGFHNQTIAAQDIPDCHEIDGVDERRCAECDYDLHDLACYQAEGDMNSACYCAPRGDQDIRTSMLAHSCETREVLESEVPGVAYTGLCRVPLLAAIPTPAPPPLQPDELYRCEGLPTYHSDEGTVNCLMGGSERTAACFSAEDGVPWQCFTEETRNERCSELRTRSSSGTFDGSCVFNGAEAWANAGTYPVQEEVTHARRRRTASPSNHRGDAPRAAPLALSSLLLALASAGAHSGAGHL